MVNAPELKVKDGKPPSRWLRRRAISALWSGDGNGPMSSNGTENWNKIVIRRDLSGATRPESGCCFSDFHPNLSCKEETR